MSRENDPYIKHTLGDRHFYRKKGRDETITWKMPPEGCNNSKEEDGVNEQWFEERMAKFTSFIKHTLGDRHFYRKEGRDETITLEKPPEGYKKCKEEDGINEQWFEDRYPSHNNKPWLKWD